MPCVVCCLATNKTKTFSYFFVDGQGIAHPRRPGVASHFGLLVDTPTIGVAKSRLCGTDKAINEEIGSHEPLMDKNEQIGWIYRSKKKMQTLYISRVIK